MSESKAMSTSTARKVWDFHGGIHPPENKLQSLQVPIRQAGIPPELIIPLSQHLGAPAEPIVTVGQRVLKGEKIANANGFISVPKHAPTSATVTAIENRPIAHSSGLPAPCIVLTPDHRDEWISHAGVADFQSLAKTDLIALIREAGIAGMGGAGFPAAVKLNVSPETPIQTLIINGTECEPYITADDVLMRERAEQIIGGAEILRHLVNPQETVIGVEDNKPEGIAALREAAQGTGIEIAPFPTKYPSGGEKQLIEILTGKQVPSGSLPASVGVVCQNIGSTVAIFQAVTQGVPLISRITTLTGEAIATPGNVEVLLGTPIQWLLEQAGYQSDANERLIMGGPMMGFAISDLSAPVIKTTNCLLAPKANELPVPPPAQACIRCGMCSEACPASLLPQQLYWFAQGKEFEKLETHNLFDCIECGACSWVCPSNIPLVQYYRASKAEIQQSRRDHAKSEHSRTRFEARQERVEQEALAKEQQRRDRKAAAEKRAAEAAAGDSSEDPIQAAIERAKAKKAGTESTAADPAQAAIEKAKAARAASADKSPQEKAQDNLQKLKDRKTKSEQRLIESREAEAQDKVIEALEASIVKLAEKILEAEIEVAEFDQAEVLDPAQAAIERAKAKRAAAAAAPPMSAREQLQKNQSAVEKRLQTAREKLAEAEANSSDTVEVLQMSIEKLNTKLEQVQSELTELED